MQQIISKMQGIVDIIVIDFKSDFQYDIEDLQDFDGLFFWSPRPSGTHMMTIEFDDKTLDWLFKDERQKYLFGYSRPRQIMENNAGNFDSDIIRNSDYLYWYDGKELKRVNLVQAKSLYKEAVKLQLALAISRGCPVVV